MPTPEERDFPRGHPKAADYDPTSPEAREWARLHYAPLGERDWPVGHPAAIDTPGNKNTVEVRAGIDPDHPELEEFSGRTPAQVAAARALDAQIAAAVKESVAPDPGLAPPPPDKPGTTQPPSGQPG